MGNDATACQSRFSGTSPATATVAECSSSATPPVDGLLPSSLGGDEPEDDGLVRRYRGQRLEPTGALVVILEQEPLSTYAGQQALREPVIAALDQPAALLVAATKMQAERNAGTLSEDDVVQLETEVKPALGGQPNGVDGAIGGIEEQRIVGSVELDVFADQPHEPVDFVAQDFGEVGEEVFQRVRLDYDPTAAYFEVWHAVHGHGSDSRTE